MSFIFIPHLECGAIIFDSAINNWLNQFDRIHYSAALIVSGCIAGSNSNKVLNCLQWSTLELRRTERRMVLMYDLKHNNLPMYIQNLFYTYRNPNPDLRLRRQQEFHIPRGSSQRFRRSTIPVSITAWDSIPNHMKDLYSKNTFKYIISITFWEEKRNCILVSSKLSLLRNEEIALNRTKAVLIFKSHLFNVNLNVFGGPCMWLYLCNFKVWGSSKKHWLILCLYSISCWLAVTVQLINQIWLPPRTSYSSGFTSAPVWD
jgi:hypothetical protein